MAAKSPNFYSQVINITQEYLGPAAERFISRQIENHLGKEPQDLKRGDMEELVVWINLAMNVLISDHEIVQEYTSKLDKLSKSKP